MCGIFLTGCGTDIGKTVVTASLLIGAKKLGINATVYKPVQTGCSTEIGLDGKPHLSLPDLDFIARICATDEKEAENIRKHYSYSYLPACSPHLASYITKEEDISISKLFCDIKEIEKDYDLVIVEGAGGLMVPINPSETFRDLAVMLRYETLLVTDNRLGCVNEALLSIEALVNKEIPPLGIIMNNTTAVTESDSYIRKDNPKIISNYTGIPVISELPYCDDFTRGNIKFWDNTSDSLVPIIEHIISLEHVR